MSDECTTTLQVFSDTAARVKASAENLGMKLYERTSQLIANGFKHEHTQRQIVAEQERWRRELRKGPRIGKGK